MFSNNTNKIVSPRETLEFSSTRIGKQSRWETRSCLTRHRSFSLNHASASKKGHGSVVKTFLLVYGSCKVGTFNEYE